MAQHGPGHRLNHQGSITPQLMEDINGEFHYAVMIHTTGGGVTALKIMRPPTVNATPEKIQEYIDAKANGTEVVKSMNLFGNSIIALRTPGGPLRLPIVSHEGPHDDHFGIAVGVDYLNRVWISGNPRQSWTTGNISHSGGLHWICYDPVDGEFDDPAAWSEPAYPQAFTACGPNYGHTYHHYCRLTDGTLILFLSQSDDVGSSKGRDFLAMYINSSTNNSWQPLITTALPPGGDPGHSVTGGHFIQSGPGASANVSHNNIITNMFDSDHGANRSYVNAVMVEQKSPTIDRLHVLFSWRTADSDGRSNINPGYVYCDNPVGNSNGWKTVSGHSQPMPLGWTETIDNRTGQNLSITQGNLNTPGNLTVSRSIGAGIAIDEDGYPHFNMENGSRYNSAEPADGFDGANIFRADTTIPNYTASVYESTLSTNNATVKRAVMNVWWDGTSWKKRGITYSDRGFSSNPVVAFVDGKGMMLSSRGSHVLGLAANYGEDYSSPAGGTGEIGFKFGKCVTGSEVNIDPVSMLKRGEIAVLLPYVLNNVDYAEVFYFGNNNHAVTNTEANNTNPGGGV